MANRFDQSQYRPQHSGDSVFPSSQGYYGNGQYPQRPAGGSDVPRKPKPKSPASSGGMALPLPEKEKVGLW